jgi:hypothetical protein
MQPPVAGSGWLKAAVGGGSWRIRGYLHESERALREWALASALLKDGPDRTCSEPRSA